VNPERTREFYETTLGLTFVSDDQFALVFDANGTMLRIQKVKQFDPPGHTALGWNVDNINTEVVQLNKRGVEFARYEGLGQDENGIWTPPSGAKVAWFKDPDGNVLSLTQFERFEVSGLLVRRIVPNLTTDEFDACKAFYSDFLGLKLAMDLGWIMTFVSPDNPTAQINIGRREKETLPFNGAISIEVGDVNNMYELAKEKNITITYPLTEEPWGVRRFFVRDPNGVIVNIMNHIEER
jgi:catechol 2,3-dioxygenase-like lactoylglutathione lyase family enzyme